MKGREEALTGEDIQHMTTITYPQCSGEVVRTVDVDGVQVDIIAHRHVSQATIESPMVLSAGIDYQAARAGTYTIFPPSITFRDTAYPDGPAAGTWSSSRGSRIDPASASLGESGSIAGAIAAARRNLTTAKLLKTYGPVAHRASGELDLSGFQDLPVDGEIRVGDVVAACGSDLRYRRAVAVGVGRSNVRYLFAARVGGRLTFGSGKVGAAVRLIRREAGTVAA